MSEVMRIKVKPNSMKLSAKVAAVEPQTKREEITTEQIIEQRLKASFEKGYASAENEVREELENEYNNRLHEKIIWLNNLYYEFEKKLVVQEQDYDKIVLQVSFLIAESILKKELEKDSIIFEVLKEAISKIVGANEVVVKLNPSDYEMLNEAHQKIYSETFKKIKYEATEGIERGGCLIESEIGNVDARMSSRISELKKHLENNLYPQFNENEH